MVNFQDIENKWQSVWSKAGIGKVDRDGSKKKFFIIFAYPGISGFLHVGHMRGYSYTDMIARYKRMQGYNVLFPVGTHASGNQAISFAKKVKEKDLNWINYLKNNGCSDEQLKKLTEPEKIVDYFNNVYLNEYWKKFGFLFDERRFICTIHPDYNKFIQWQFKKLYDNNLLTQKPYFATFCPSCGPVAVDPSETDISKGGNAEKVEYTLLKFKFGDLYLVAATLRPETVYGQTNLWVNPDVKYAKVKVGNEVWVISEPAFEKLKYQKEGMEFVGHVNGKDLLSKHVIAPGIHKKIIILPAKFCDPVIGTGIVTSVPSDAPYDYIALKDLQNNEKLLREYGLNVDEVKNIKPIPIIKTKGYSENPAEDIVKRLGIKSQKDVEKLEQATKEIYKLGFHTGVMRDNCEEFAGKRVEVAKELVKEKLLQNNEADILHDLSEEVVCRCGENVIIKKINNQWFIRYSDSELTLKSKEHAMDMFIIPKEYHNNIGNVLDWFQDRACARLGNWLGTKLPFDDEWTIEPISDSTLYPAYYIIAPYVNSGKIKVEDLSEEFFDYVFLGKDSDKVDKTIAEEVKKDFEYWYPLDINLGGKEHQTVHFPVFIMNHVAILNKQFWPKGIFVNWWVIGKGSKISKSKGGAEPIPGAIEKYSVDGMRLYYAHIGNPDVDVVWDEDVVKSYKNILEKILNIVNEVKGLEHSRSMVDNWLESLMNDTIKSVTDCMDNFELRNAANLIYFQTLDNLRWYLRRGGSNVKLLREFIEAWAKLMCPITPHVAEEVNEIVGNKDIVTSSSWAKFNDDVINPEYNFVEQMIKKILTDARNITKLAKMSKVKKLTLFVAPEWKFSLIESLKKELTVTRDLGRIMKVVLANDNLKKFKGVDKLIINLTKNPAKIPEIVLDQEKEFNALQGAKQFFEKELSCKVEVVRAEQTTEPKALQALPGKPAILLE